MKIPSSIAAMALLAGCASIGPGGGDGGAKAAARLQPTSGNSAAGTVIFHQHGNKVAVHAELTGLKPNAEHAFHVHEKGDCSAADATSAGGHYNPTGKPHGPQGGEHHAGDMPSVKSDASGNAKASFELSGVSAADLVGKGVIVHRDPDDYKSQPAGNAGPRIACGVITRST